MVLKAQHVGVFFSLVLSYLLITRLLHRPQLSKVAENHKKNLDSNFKCLFFDSVCKFKCLNRISVMRPMILEMEHSNFVLIDTNKNDEIFFFFTISHKIFS